MNKKGRAIKSIELAFDFARYLIDHPKELEKIPDGREISFNEKTEVVLPKNYKRSKENIQVDVKHNF